MRFFAHLTQFDKAGIRGEPFDVVIGGWGADYAGRVRVLRRAFVSESFGCYVCHR